MPVNATRRYDAPFKVHSRVPPHQRAVTLSEPPTFHPNHSNNHLALFPSLSYRDSGIGPKASWNNAVRAREIHVLHLASKRRCHCPRWTCRSSLSLPTLLRSSLVHVPSDASNLKPSCTDRSSLHDPCEHPVHEDRRRSLRVVFSPIVLIWSKSDNAFMSLQAHSMAH